MIFDVIDARHLFAILKTEYKLWSENQEHHTAEAISLILMTNHLREWIAPDYNPDGKGRRKPDPPVTAEQRFSREVYENSHFRMRTSTPPQAMHSAGAAPGDEARQFHRQKPRPSVLPLSGGEALALGIGVLLRRLRDVRQLYGQLADDFGLTQDQGRAPYPSRGDEPGWHKLVQFARQRLVELGWLDSSRRGLWSLTPEGHKMSELREKPINGAELGL